MQKKKSRKAVDGLRVIQSDVAGIDLGCREHYVCCPPQKTGTPNVRSFKTTTPELVRLASAASRATGIDAITFNAAGLHSRTVSRQYGAGQSSSIQSHVTRFEILNTVQDWTPLPDSVGTRTLHDAEH